MPLFPRSSIAKKIFNGVTGAMLIGFIIIHLIGNLFLLTGNPDDFNGYAYKLHSFGWLLYAAEIGLALVFLGHIVSALSVARDKRKARPSRYAVKGNAGGNSRKTISSTTMIVSGLLLLVFLVWHVITFRFGPYIETTLDGQQVRDLYKLTVGFFQNQINVAIYIGVMVFLGFHLRHGFWSMFQSLGAYHPRYTNIIYSLGIVFALLMTVGFILIPVWIYFTTEPVESATALGGML